MKTDIGSLRERIIAEAREQLPLPPTADEITSAILAKELNCSKRQAYNILQNMVEEGKATVRDNGIAGCKVYRRIISD